MSWSKFKKREKPKITVVEVLKRDMSIREVTQYDFK